MTAQMICKVRLFVAKRLDRYCGSVIESFAASEKQRRRRATMIQFAIVPRARPIPIQIWPKPKARIEPGRPISSHADMSDACALIAVTHGPIWRPPRKYSFSPAPRSLKKNTTPMASISTKYSTNARTSAFIIKTNSLTNFSQFPRILSWRKIDCNTERGIDYRPYRAAHKIGFTAEITGVF